MQFRLRCPSFLHVTGNAARWRENVIVAGSAGPFQISLIRKSLNYYYLLMTSIKTKHLFLWRKNVKSVKLDSLQKLFVHLCLYSVSVFNVTCKFLIDPPNLVHFPTRVAEVCLSCCWGRRHNVISCMCHLHSQVKCSFSTDYPDSSQGSFSFLKLIRFIVCINLLFRF